MKKLLIGLLCLAALAAADDPNEIAITRLAEGAPPLETHAEYLARRGPLPTTTAEPTALPVIGNGPGDDLYILMNEDLYPGIETSYGTWAADLAAEGYVVHGYTSAPATPETIKSWLIGWFNDTGSMEGLILVGDYDSAWFQGIFWSDIGYEEFPCDLFFTDLDGDWRDDEDSSGASVSDGIYDYHEDGSGDLEPEIYLGRVPAHNLNLFSGHDEASIVNAWLDRVHAFRSGSWTLSHDSLTYVDHDWQASGNYWSQNVEQVYSNETNVWPNVDGEGYQDRLNDNTYEHILMCCHSSPVVHAFHDGPNVNNYYVNASDHQWAVHNLFACSNARYTSDNNMGAVYALDPDGAGLISIGSTKTGSMLEFDDFYGYVASGMSWGEAFTAWFALVGEGEEPGWDRQSARGWFYGMTLIGDPTLLPSADADVTLASFTAESVDRDVLLAWSVEADGPTSINLYRLDDEGARAGRTRLNDTPLDGGDAGRFLDRDAAGDRVSYVLEVVEADGRITEFGPVDCELDGADIGETRILGVSPNPVRSSAVVTLELATGDTNAVELALYDLAGRRVATLVEGSLAAGRHVVAVDASSLETGVYLLRLSADDATATGRLVITR